MLYLQFYAAKEKQTICAILSEHMPLKTPSSPSKSSGKPKGKTVTPSHGKDKEQNASGEGKVCAPLRQPELVSVSWWDTLSPERKLDVVGAIMAVVGLLTVLILFSAQRSALTGSMMRLLGQMFGWGIYILPVGLIVMGLWLIFRRIEKLPPLSLERATGIILFFLWLLASCIRLSPLPDMAEAGCAGWQAADISGVSLQRILFNGFGTGERLLSCWHGC